MNLARKTLSVILALCLTAMIPGFSTAANGDYPSSSVSESEPIVNKSSEENIPVKTETKVSGWTWLVLALLAAGGGAAAAMGGGKSGGSSPSSSAASTTSGNAVVHW